MKTKTRSAISLIVKISFLVLVILWNVPSSLADTYTCPTNSTTYATSLACSSACTQTQNCNINSLSLSGGTSTAAPQSGMGTSAMDMLVGNGNQICFYGYIGYVQSKLGCISITGFTASGSTGTSSQNTKITSSGNQICMSGGLISSSLGCITLSGASASGNTNTWTGLSSMNGSGSKLCFSGQSGVTASNQGCITLTPTTYSCPITGGSSCAGSPQTCSGSLSCTVNASINGSCGPSDGTSVPAAPVSGFCNTGSYSGISGTGPWTWSCLGANGGSTSSCSAAISAPTTNGVCGTDNGQTLSTTPVNLCSIGSPSAVAGTGPWSWTCAGTNGGSTASCSALKSVPPNILTASVATGLTVNSTLPDATFACTSSTCTKSYPSGTLVTISATTALPGYTFSNWTGCDSTSGSTCTITMNATKSVQANATCSTTDNCATTTCGNSCTHADCSSGTGTLSCPAAGSSNIKSYKEVAP